jgi:long-chain acyl-CoA synthetase
VSSGGVAGVLGHGAGTVTGLLSEAARTYPNRVAILYKDADGRKTVTFPELEAVASELARGLLELGLRPGERVGLICGTRPEWTYADFAITLAGGVVVPIYPTSTPEEIAWLLDHAEAAMVVCETGEQRRAIERVRAGLGHLREVIVAVADQEELGDDRTFAGLRARAGRVPAARLEEIATQVAPADPYTIMYTSGTSGSPKGCVLSHANLAASVRILEQRGLFARDGDLVYLYLPLAHAFGILMQLAACQTGSTLAYYGGDTSTILDEIVDLRPTYLPSVPRILEKIYAAAIGEARGATVARAVELAEASKAAEVDGPPLTAAETAELQGYEHTIFARLRALLGGRVREVGVGAAPMSAELPRLFRAAGVSIMEGYGMTEASGLCASNTPRASKLGTVGRPLPCIDVRIAEDGEVLVRGPVVFSGYHRSGDESFGAVTNGWLETGDLGRLDEDGYLIITGRKKDLIITAGGENVAPSSIEGALKMVPWISQVVAYGDRRPFLVVLITLNIDELRPWANAAGLGDLLPAELADHPRILERVEAEVARVNASQRRAARIARFFVLERDLSHEAGELTPSMKVKRQVVHEVHAARFAALYNG